MRIVLLPRSEKKYNHAVSESYLHPSFSTRMLLYSKRKKCDLLLLSFMLLIFGNTFTDHNDITGIVVVYQNMVIGMLAFYNKKWLRNTALPLIIVSALLNLFASG